MTVSNSRDLLWKTQAPPFLREAWLGIDAAGAADGARAEACLDFGALTLRYAHAILLASAIAGGLPLPAQVQTLHKRPEPASLGTWSQAVEALAKAVAARPELPASALANALTGLDPSTSPLGAFRSLVEIRNRIAHSASGAIRLSEAHHHLPALRAAVRLIGAGFEPLRSLPLCFVAKSTRRHGGRVDATWIRLVGEEAAELAVEDLALGDLPDAVPFVLTRGGALLLAPWLHVVDKSGRQRVDFATPARVEPADKVFIPLDLPGQVVTWLGQGAASPEIVLPEGWVNLGELGTGAMGTVLRARRGDGPARAVKVLRAELVDLQGYAQRLRREHEAMRRLHHPNIPAVHELIDDGDRGLFLVTALVNGEPLDARIQRRALSRPDARRWIDQLLNALQHAHEQQVVHRDVKPSNVLVDEHGDAHLIDFGIARIEEQFRLTRTTDSMGTTAYAAPEQLQQGRADAQSDVFAAGRVLTELLDAVGEPAESPLRAVARVATDAAPHRRWKTANLMRQTLDPLWENPDFCPLLPGERVAGAYTVSSIGEQLRPGIWQVIAEAEGRAKWWLVVATPLGDAEAALRAHGAHLDANPALRSQLGYRTSIRTDAGWLAALFVLREGLEPGRKLFPDAPAEKKSVGSSPALDTAAAVAAGVATAGVVAAGGLLGALALIGRAAMLAKIKKGRGGR